MQAINNPFAFRRQWGPIPRYPRVLEYSPPDWGFISVSGPCSVENAAQISKIAAQLAISGVKWLRGGCFRAGTYPGPYGPNPGLMEDMAFAAKENGMKTILEVLDYRDEALKFYSKYADAFQIGCRQMQNYELLKTVGSLKRPVFLKRHPGSTLDEFLGAAEYLLREKADVILIERGSSTHMNHVRWDLSLSIIPAIKQVSKIPIIVDASHGTGRRDLVYPMTLAGIAAGADGFLVETHYDPENSLSDSDQAYPLSEYPQLYQHIHRLYDLVKRFDYERKEKQ